MSGNSLRPDRPKTSLEKKGLEFFFNRSKLSVSISPKFILSVAKVRGPLPGKKKNFNRERTKL